MKCPKCDCPMLPKGVRKRPNEYDHARGCPYTGLTAAQVKKRERTARRN